MFSEHSEILATGGYQEVFKSSVDVRKGIGRFFGFLADFLRVFGRFWPIFDAVSRILVFRCQNAEQTTIVNVMGRNLADLSDVRFSFRAWKPLPLVSKQTDHSQQPKIDVRNRSARVGKQERNRSARVENQETPCVSLQWDDIEYDPVVQPNLIQKELVSLQAR